MTLVPPDFRGGGSDDDLPRVALGYKQDPHDERDVPAERMLGASPNVLVPASMLKYRVGDLWQGGAGSCVAHALARAEDMSLRYQAEKLGRDASRIPKSSRRFRYYNARRQEAVDAIARGEAAPTMHDGGCYPRLAMRAEQKIGFCDEAIYPYSDALDDINAVPPPAAYQAAIDQAEFKYARVSLQGNQRVIDCARAMAVGKPSIFGMFVDSAFMKNKGARIESINTRDPDGGGHMLTVLEITQDEVYFDNWWLRSWGSNGIGRMSHGLFGSSVVTDCYIIEAAPMFSEVSP